MPRLLLLLPTTTYRTTAFVEAARRIGAELTVASERPSTLEAANPTGLLTLDFQHPERAADQAHDFARRSPIDAVVGVDDYTARGTLCTPPRRRGTSIASANSSRSTACRYRDSRGTSWTRIRRRSPGASSTR